jgi:hypothetical protein
VLLRRARQGVIYFKFYITRWFFSRFFILYAASIVKIGSSGGIRWRYSGTDPLSRSGGVVVVVSVSEVLLSC